jgi:putative addiction module component (TIGR02574 family)
MVALNREQVLAAALQLPKAEQVQLVDALIATLSPEDGAPLDDAWLAEIDRRSREFDAGNVTSIPWSEVKERARRRVHHRA